MKVVDTACVFGMAMTCVLHPILDNFQYILIIELSKKQLKVETFFAFLKPFPGQLPFSKIDKETAVKLTQMSPIRSQLLALRECAAELKDENLALKDELNTLRVGQAELDKKHEAALLELRQYFDDQRELDSEKLRKEFEQRVKDAEESKSKSSERIRELEKELEEAKGGRLCQICFENPRDCIIMPCTHLLYCRTCVAEHKRKGDSRCPTCRGPISGEMLCNVNH